METIRRTESFEMFLEGSIFAKTEYKKVNTQGHKYLDFLVSSCPVSTEAQFNRWVSCLPGIEKPNKKQAILTECLFIIFLNWRVKPTDA